MTIDITPTWSGLLPYLLNLYESGPETARQTAKEELARMAKAADFYNSLTKKHSAEEATA